MQAGPPVLESRRAVRGGATATKAASASTSTHAAAPAQQHTRTIACTHLHAYYGTHKHGMQALARTPPCQRRHARGTYLVPRRHICAVL